MDFVNHYENGKQEILLKKIERDLMLKVMFQLVNHYNTYVVSSKSA